MSQPNSTSATNRQRLIRLVHVAKRELNMADDAYRTILSSRFNKASAADLTVPELEQLVSHLKNCGFKVRKNPSARAQATDAQSQKIRALWLALSQAGVVRDSSEQALGSFVKRMTGVDALQWLKPQQASGVIEELKKWCARKGVDYAA